ncbi:MAG: DUF222 domain-containing protein [Gordonia sp. (in: high G+C Gram-positive bacteria)]
MAFETSRWPETDLSAAGLPAVDDRTSLGSTVLGQRMNTVKNAQAFMDWEQFQIAMALYDELSEHPEAPGDEAGGSDQRERPLVDVYACAQLAVQFALETTVYQAQMLLDDAFVARDRLPECAALLRIGRLDRRRFHKIAVETDLVIDAEHARILDARIAADLIAQNATTLSENAVAELARRHVVDVDPDAARRRRDRAVKARSLSSRQLPDGMSSLTATATAEDVRLAEASVDAVVDGLCPNDPRTKAAARSDVAIARLTGRRFTCLCDREDCTARLDQTALDARTARIVVHAMCQGSTLAGDDDSPAYLDGHGPITAAHLRELAERDDAVVHHHDLDDLCEEIDVDADEDADTDADDDDADADAAVDADDDDADADAAEDDDADAANGGAEDDDADAANGGAEDDDADVDADAIVDVDADAENAEIGAGVNAAELVDAGLEVADAGSIEGLVAMTGAEPIDADGGVDVDVTVDAEVAADTEAGPPCGPDRGEHLPRPATPAPSGGGRARPGHGWTAPDSAPVPDVAAAFGGELVASASGRFSDAFMDGCVLVDPDADQLDAMFAQTIAHGYGIFLDSLVFDDPALDLTAPPRLEAVVSVADVDEPAADASSSVRSRVISRTSLPSDGYRPNTLTDLFVRFLWGHCSVPGCHRPAFACDLDHAEEYDNIDPAQGGPTCVCNLLPKCRYHHLVKTHAEQFVDELWIDGRGCFRTAATIAGITAEAFAPNHWLLPQLLRMRCRHQLGAGVLRRAAAAADPGAGPVRRRTRTRAKHDRRRAERARNRRAREADHADAPRPTPPRLDDDDPPPF